MLESFNNQLLTDILKRAFFPETPRGFSHFTIDGYILMLQELEHQVLEVYRLLDTAIAGFASRTGLSCPQSCGLCCLSKKVEATILECIPLAFKLFSTFQAELILRRLEKNSEELRCVLYRSDSTGMGLGCCTQYKYRAVVCRLFGFAGNRDREGIPRLAMCRVMKERNSVPAGAILLDHPDTPMPLFIDAGLRMTTLNPSLGTVRMPINIAIREALLKVGMLLDLAAPAGHNRPDDPEIPPNKPLLPCSTLGRRAA